MAAALNEALGRERSRISTRERERLDRIANSKQLSDGRATLHPRYVQVVEKSGDRLFLGMEEVDFSNLLDRARDNFFEWKYFKYEDLEAEISDFCLFINAFDDEDGSFFETSKSEAHAGDNEPGPSSKKTNQKSISEWIVGHIAGVYKRVFGLDPYLGGVGVNEECREPNSPFGVFAKFVLDGLDIRTRNGSRYSLHTIKNCLHVTFKASRLPDEPELVAAREELEKELSLKRGRGRPRKKTSEIPARQGPPINLVGAGNSNGTPDTN